MRVSECQEEAEKALESENLQTILKAIHKARGGDDVDEGDSSGANIKPIGISCQKCDVNARAYFSAPAHRKDSSAGDEGGPYIVLCANYLRTGQVGHILRHELVHAYDHYVNMMDLTKGDDLACSEVRAAKAAECTGSHAGGLHFLCEMGGYEEGAQDSNGVSGFCKRLREKCVRSHAEVSTKKVFPKDGKRFVASCFRRCYDAATLGKVTD